jgi:predicted RNA-binding protein with PUA-like domain
MAGFWLVKSEPDKYSWDQLVKDRKTTWDGIRSFEARNNLRAMKKGELVLFYHSNVGKEIVGVARVAREARPDPAAEGEDWSVVDIEVLKPLSSPVTLARIKSDPELADFALIKRGRLSVVPVAKSHFEHILRLAKTKL